MKVNFWQGLGIVLIIVGVIFYVRSKIGDATVDPPSNPPAVTQPADTQGAGTPTPTPTLTMRTPTTRAQRRRSPRSRPLPPGDRL